MEIEDKGHSPVGASGRYRFKACPGSVNLIKTVPKAASSSYADEGTRAHEVAAHYLEHGVWPLGVPDEMKEHLKVYIEAVFEDQAAFDEKAEGNLFLVEHGFDLKMLHPEAWGTADCVLYNAKTSTLYVYDLKYGAGITVEVSDDGIPNEQLVYYAVGAFLSLNLPCKKVILKIAQPRCPHADGLVRSFEFDSLDLLGHASDIEAEIKLTDRPDAPLNPGTHCKFCPAAGVCSALQSKSLVVAQQIFSDLESYDPQALSDTLNKLPMVEAFVSQVREFAYAEAMKGRVPPGFKLVAKRATRKWHDPQGVDKFLSTVLNRSLIHTCYTEPELKTPAQIEKILPKAERINLKDFCTAESSGFKLAHLSEKGEPVFLDAKTIFNDVTDET